MIIHVDTIIVGISNVGGYECILFKDSCAEGQQYVHDAHLTTLHKQLEASFHGILFTSVTIELVNCSS